MAEQSSQRKSYVKECLRLLYWVYFKPFTLRQWLDLEERTRESVAWKDNWFELSLLPQLQYLGDQVRLLITLVPLVIVPLMGLLYTGLLYTVLSFQSFLWKNWAIFMLFWVMGIWLVSSLRRLLFILLLGGTLGSLAIIDGLGLNRSEVSSLVMFGVMSGVFIGVLSFSLIKYNDSSFRSNTAINVSSSILFSVVSGIALGVIIGILGNIAGSLDITTVIGRVKEMSGIISLGTIGGMAFSLVFSLALGVEGCIGWGVPLAVTGGLVLGKAISIEAGVVFGVTFILGVLRIYFWLFECLRGCILYIRSREGNVARWLPYLPYYTDELIILPIPFMSTLIVKAYQENSVLAQQTLHYLSTSTNQQRLATRATKDIVVELLQSCRTPSEIAAMTDHLAWISSPATKAVDAFLLGLLDVSRGVQAAVESSSFARQAYLLRSPVGTLQRLRLGRASNTPGEAATFESILQSWLSILETAQRVATEQAQHEGELPLAYVAGSALDPESAGDLFKGRRDLFREMETLVIAPQPPVLFLYGGRRAGKTSTLKYLPKRVGPEFLPLLIDMQGTASTTTLAGFVESLVKQMQEAARQSRNTQLPAPEMETFKHEPLLALQAWFAQLERALPEQRFLLCLDEFERLDEVIETTKSRAPLNFLRNLMQHHKRWIVLFSGSHTPDEMPLYWSDYLISVKTIKVGYLAKEEARDLIVHPSEHFPEIYDDQTIDAILQLTHCQPYLIQLVCSMLVDHLNRAKRRQATSQDIQDIIPQVFDQGMMYFREFWHKSLTQEQRQALLLLLKGEQGKQEEQALRLLLQKEILEHIDGEYRFQIPLLRMYIEQRETVPSPIVD